MGTGRCLQSNSSTLGKNANPLCATQEVSCEGNLEQRGRHDIDSSPTKYRPFPRPGWDLNMPACFGEEEPCPASTLLGPDRDFGQIHLTACKANYLSPDPNGRFSHGIELQILVFPLDPATSSPSY